jgi:hypothetical protein
VFVVDLALLLGRAFAADISPFDEGYHLSYVQYMYQWSLPRLGDTMGSWSEQMYACHPTYPFGQVTAVPCGVDGPSGAYPEGGANTAAAWPPIYYLVVSVLVRPLIALGAEPLYAARAISCLLWAAGSVLVAHAVMAHRGGIALGVSAGIMATTMPAAWALGSYVTPHSTAMLIGASVIYLLAWASRSRRPVGIVAALTAIASMGIILTLPHAILALGIASVAAVALACSESHQRVRLMSFAVTASLVGVATYFAWGVVNQARARGAGPSQPVSPAEGVLVAARDNWNLFWPRGLHEIQFLNGPEAQLATLIAYGSIALVGYWLLSESAVVQRGVALGLVLAAPILSVGFAYVLNFPLPTRYGASGWAFALFLMALPSASGVVRGVIVGLTVVTATVAVMSFGHFMILVPA